jgi:hypothetical protein
MRVRENVRVQGEGFELRFKLRVRFKLRLGLRVTVRAKG